MKAIIDNIRLRPKNCVWEITSKCNMHCLHCASNLDETVSRQHELTLEEAFSLGRELADLGCEEITLSGGEALLRNDWEELARYLVKLGMRIALISNGYIINEATASRIKKSGIYLVALSFDGLEASHNTVRQNENSFRHVCQAAAWLKKNQLKVNLVTHVNKLNIGELPLMEEFIHAMDINVWRIQLGVPFGRLKNNPAILIDPADLPTVADFIVAAKKRGQVIISVGDNIGYYSQHEPVIRDTPQRCGWNFWCGCAAGCLNVGIESNGNVKGCLSLQADRFIEGNVRNESLTAIWNKKGNFAYTRDFKLEDLNGACRDCEYGEICRGGCPFMAYGATGSLYNNPFCLYQVTKPQVTQFTG